MLPDSFNKLNLYYREKTPFLFIIDYKLENVIVRRLDEIDTGEILYQLNKHTNARDIPPVKIPVQLKPLPCSFGEFEQKIKAVQKEILYGNSYLLNLSCKTPLQGSYDLEAIFHASKAPYKLMLKDKFVVFSPESFVRIEDKRISTFPMKGTKLKTDDNSEKELLADKKEAAEHATITDLLRNDLSRVAEKVGVKRYRYIDEIKTADKTILQVSSEIEGMLLPEFRNDLSGIFREILPAGSVTGAPKPKTCRIIEEVEGYSRNFYTGVFGLYDGKKLDSAVMIRFIEKEGTDYYYKSGGGITFMSSPDLEYQEMIDKIYVPVY